MSKPKIAVLIDWYLPGTKAGGPVRSVYSLVHLLKEHYNFYIITTNKDLGESQPYKDIKSDTLLSEEGINYYYFSHELLNSGNIRSLFDKINPDLIYLNSFWSFHFSIEIVRSKNKGLIKSPVLLAPRGMLGKGAMSLKATKKRTYIALARLLGWYKNIPFHATQEQEAKDVRSKFRASKILIAPNINSSPATQNKSEKIKNHLKLFYLSRIARVKNLHFAIQSLKEIPSEYTIEYDIFGNLEDKEYWNECLELINQLPAHVKVNYKSELAFDKVQQTICNYNALLMPTLNENFGHSIVESLLCGCPVIISDQTPWNDIQQQGVGYALNLNNLADFTASVISLAKLNQEEFNTKSNLAINYIRNKIDLDVMTEQYKNMFNECLKN